LSESDKEWYKYSKWAKEVIGELKGIADKLDKLIAGLGRLIAKPSPMEETSPLYIYQDVTVKSGTPYDTEDFILEQFDGAAHAGFIEAIDDVAYLQFNGIGTDKITLNNADAQRRKFEIRRAWGFEVRRVKLTTAAVSMTCRVFLVK